VKITPDKNPPVEIIPPIIPYVKINRFINVTFKAEKFAILSYNTSRKATFGTASALLGYIVQVNDVKKLLRSIQFGFLLLVLPLGLSGQFFYGLHQEYGKNRVEFNEFNWKYYRFEKLDIYFYKSSEEVAERASYMAHENLRQLEKLLDAPISDRMHIVVFNNLSELKQSNLIASDEDAYNTGGVTHIAGNKMFLYFDGTYSGLEGQMRSGMAEMVINNLIYGSFTESFKNSTLLNFPEWYFEGLVSYLSGPLSAADEAMLMDGFVEDRFKRFNVLTGREARVAGHSIWSFVAETYGRKVIRNILFMAVVNRNVDEGFNNILGTRLKEILVGWSNFYRERFDLEGDRDPFEDLPGERVFRARKDERITHLAIDRMGKNAAYVVNRQGRYKLRILDLITGKDKTINRGGYRIPQNADYSFPVPAWHPNGRILAFLTEEKGYLWLNFYDREKKKIETKEFFKFDKVLSMQYSSDGKQLLMSAVKDGRSDIYIYTILSTAVEAITQDPYDDLDPVFVQGNKRILFRSNRPKDTLKVLGLETEPSFSNNYDLFIANRTGKNQDWLWRLTRTPGINENQLNSYGNARLTYVSQMDGFRNTYMLEIDSSIAYVDTTVHYDYSFDKYQLTERKHHVLLQAVNDKASTALNTYYVDGREQLRMLDMDDGERQELIEEAQSEGALDEEISREVQRLSVELVPSEKERPEGDINILNYQFHPSLTGGRQRNRQKPNVEDVNENNVVLAFPAKNANNVDSLTIPVARNYFTSLYQDEFTTQIDNIFANPQYQIYLGQPSPTLFNPGFNMLFKVGVVDLFNNYRMVAGLRTDFQPVPGLSLSPNSEIFLGMVDDHRRLNQGLVLYRQSKLGDTRSDLGQPASFLFRTLVHEARYTVRWPFNPVSSIEVSGAFRNDRLIILSVDGFSARQPATTEDRGILRAAYIYDNSRKLGLNLYDGLKFKAFTEYYRNFSISNSGMHTLGFDLRHYYPIHRTFIWANRLAYGTSFGQEKLVHFMGGVDNEFSPRFDYATPVADNENYVYQTVVTNMRGFVQNIRNGNSFAVFNSELRFPIFKYILNRPIRNDFIANFQIVGFADAGTAWNGPNPWSEENALNNLVISKPPSIKVTVDRQKDPFVYGTGIGLRTRLLGYFIRGDWAWGIEDGQILPSVFYFSMSTDF
jgi:hypothetical protein